jgi:hypothetical protein
MATKGSKMLTLRDVKSGTLPDGSFDRAIVEMMHDENPSLRDIPFQECNDGSQHISTIRTGLPTAVWKEYYKGVPASKSSKKQVINATGALGAKIIFDYDLYTKEAGAGNGTQFLADEAAVHGEAIGQAAATALFYGNIASDPKGINGFFKSYAAYGAMTTDDRTIANFVINGKGTDASTAALRSIMLVGWGSRSMFGLVPKGASMGLAKSAIKEQQLPDDDGNLYNAGIQDLSYNIGLCIKDFRYGCRIANIQLDKWDATGAPDYFDLLTSAKIRAKSNGDIKRVWYMSKKTWEIIVRQLGKTTRANAYTYGDVNNGNVPDSLMGIPVAQDDSLEVNETAVASV